MICESERCDHVPAFGELKTSLIAASLELFEAYESVVKAIEFDEEDASIEDSVIAMIGFATADGSRGSLTLAAHKTAVMRFLPEEMEGDADTATCDVLGEFANMLLGRLKNMLLPRGATLLLGTPTTGLVWKLRLSSPVNSFCWLAFAVGPDVVRVRFDATLMDSFQLCANVPSLGLEIGEGEILMF